MKKLRAPELKQVHICDGFWSERVRLVHDAIIPYQWKCMNDQIPDAEPSHCLDNFRIAAGDKNGEFYGAVFQDTDIAKWLEAVGDTLAVTDDPELEARADAAIDLICRAQQKDGYLDTYFIIKEPEKRWTNLCEGHELYTAGHMMEAAVSYYQGTGKRKLLDAAARLADLLCETFGPEKGKMHSYPGHPEVEIGLIRLADVTGEEKYRDLAKYFVDTRGTGENWFLREMKRPGFRHIFPEFDPYDPAYSQSDRPVREQTHAEGHAVRAMYLYSAMADLAEAYHDETLLDACRRLWDDATRRQMYVTGSVGSSGMLERFTTDYDLPNDCNYSETCASVGLMMFGIRMARITREAKYADTVERALYNTVLAGVALDGKSFFYVNPLEVWPDACLPRTSREHVKPVRQKWFGVACCPPNIARTLASLGQYAVMLDDSSVYVNLFIGGSMKTDLGGKCVTITSESRFPYEGQYRISFADVPEEGITLYLRIPDYAENIQITAGNRGLTISQNLSGCQMEKNELLEMSCAGPESFEEQSVCPVRNGYAEIRIPYDMTVEMTCSLPVRILRANPNVRADCGKVCLQRGPLVYCLEEIDNGKNLSEIYLDAEKPVKAVKSDLFGGCVVLEASGRRLREDAWSDGALYAERKPAFVEVPLRAVPYFCWNNRGEGEMTVWMKEFLH
ncbi:MAG: glycoside hydrolase family 127 protein [Eubacteriales bacterium]|nr:glycoside hydrolase family 127 protein [Eubacteriales bacterium]